jgi:hypothetical protein
MALFLQACAGDTSMNTHNGGPVPGPKPDPHITNFYFSGSWAGTGKIAIDKDNIIKCEDVSFEFDQQAANLTIKNLSWNCGDLNRKIAAAISFDIKEGKVYYQNKQYGVISEQKLTLTIPGKNSTSTYTLSYSVPKKAIAYGEAISYSSNRKTWNVTGTVTKK